MITLFDFSRQISDFKKRKKYSEALSYFKENKSVFSKEQIASNEYIISDILSCLRHSNQYDAGFRFIEIYDIEINNEQKERILTSYGWLLWSKYKADNSNTQTVDDESHFFEDDEDENPIENIHYNKNELIGKIENLIPFLLEQDSDFSKTLLSNLFSIVLKTEKRKPTPNWKLMNDYCDHFDPDVLSKECSTIPVERKGKTIDMELASDFENWYAYKTKALLKLGEWQQCFEISKEALDRIDSFHYSNDVWFSRRVALSKKNLGDEKATINELETILKRKREWFIQKELAELYFENGELEKAFKMAIEAINNFGSLEYKVELLFLLGKILQKQGNPDLAYKHIMLSKMIRQDEEWKIPLRIIEEMNQYSDTNVHYSNTKDLKIDLQKYWRGFKEEKRRKSFDISDGNILNGEIIKILHDNDRGKDGFIRCEGREHYFSIPPSFHLTETIFLGSKVAFKITPAKDDKKERARIIKLIE